MVNFEPCPRYENKDGAHCNVSVHCGGTAPGKSKLKTVEMSFEEGRWKARVFNGVFTAVVKPFFGGTNDEGTHKYFTGGHLKCVFFWGGMVSFLPLSVRGR